VNLDQARAVAEEYFNGVRPLDQAVEVGIYSFSEGYVAWPIDIERGGPDQPPERVGGGCIVIDAATGEIVIRPLLHPEIVAEQWSGRRSR
jgi:hypothetical protein